MFLPTKILSKTTILRSEAGRVLLRLIDEYLERIEEHILEHHVEEEDPATMQPPRTITVEVCPRVFKPTFILVHKIRCESQITVETDKRLTPSEEEQLKAELHKKFYPALRRMLAAYFYQVSNSSSVIDGVIDEMIEEAIRRACRRVLSNVTKIIQVPIVSIVDVVSRQALYSTTVVVQVGILPEGRTPEECLLCFQPKNIFAPTDSDYQLWAAYGGTVPGDYHLRSLEKHNEARMIYCSDCGKLVADPFLAAAVRYKANDLANSIQSVNDITTYFRHEDTQGRGPDERIMERYSGDSSNLYATGENIALRTVPCDRQSALNWGYPVSADGPEQLSYSELVELAQSAYVADAFFAQWKNSPPHWANILNPVYQGMYYDVAVSYHPENNFCAIMGVVNFVGYMTDITLPTSRYNDLFIPGELLSCRTLCAEDINDLRWAQECTATSQGSYYEREARPYVWIWFKLPEVCYLSTVTVRMRHSTCKVHGVYSLDALDPMYVTDALKQSRLRDLTNNLIWESNTITVHAGDDDCHQELKGYFAARLSLDCMIPGDSIEAWLTLNGSFSRCNPILWARGWFETPCWTGGEIKGCGVFGQALITGTAYIDHIIAQTDQPVIDLSDVFPEIMDFSFVHVNYVMTYRGTRYVTLTEGTSYTVSGHQIILHPAYSFDSTRAFIVSVTYGLYPLAGGEGSAFDPSWLSYGEIRWLVSVKGRKYWLKSVHPNIQGPLRGSPDQTLTLSRTWHIGDYVLIFKGSIDSSTGYLYIPDSTTLFSEFRDTVYKTPGGCRWPGDILSCGYSEPPTILGDSAASHDVNPNNDVIVPIDVCDVFPHFRNPLF